MTQYKGRMFSERNAKAFSSEDVRFTQKPGTLYAFVTPGPSGGFTIRSLGERENLWSDRIANVRLLGSDERLTWSRDENALNVNQPKSLPFPYAVVLKIES